MANLKKWLIVLFLPLFALSSCSGDKDKDEPKNPDEVTTTLSKFVGFWLTNRDNVNFLFFPDETAVQFNDTYYEYKNGHGVVAKGKWQYNEELNLLATTLGNWQINITAIFEDEWTGVSVGGTVISAEKRNEDYIWDIIYGYEITHVSQWEDSEGNTPGHSLTDPYYDVSYSKDKLRYSNIQINNDISYDFGYYFDDTIVGKIIIKNAWTANPTLLIIEDAENVWFSPFRFGTYQGIK